MNKMTMEALEAYLADAGVSVFAKTDTTEAMKARLVEVTEQADIIEATADAEKRDMTDEERVELTALLDEFDQIRTDIALRERLDANAQALDQPAARKTAAKGDEAVSGHEIRPIERRSGTKGWKSFGDFATGVMRSTPQAGGHMDQRLIANAPTTYGTEGTGADGGFAVPTDFTRDIVKMLEGEDSLLARTDNITTFSNVLTLPLDTSTPWQTSGGILSAWANEAAVLAESKPALTTRSVTVHKLTTLVPVTEELLEDSLAMGAYISNKAADKMVFKVNDALVNGSGTGQPQGITGATSTVSVAKESGQTAATFNFENVLKMHNRMYAPYRNDAVWLINQDLEPQLHRMAFQDTAAAGPVYMPPGGLSAAPYGTLMGRPVIPTQACKTLGTVGDVLFTSLGQYLSVSKGGGIRSDVSIHLYFDYDITAFRFIMRLGGEPWLPAAISPLNGSNTMSSTVSLATRA